MGRRLHFEPLDGVRGIAAQVVLLDHALGAASLPGPGLAAAGLGWAARLAVMVFFGLSGFVIATSLRRHLAERGARFLLPYGAHRIARIWPPLILAVTLTFLVGAVGRAGVTLIQPQDGAYVMGVAAYLRGITLTFAPDDATFAIDRALWSLRQEVFLYGVAALVALAAAKGGVARLLAGALAAGLVAARAERFFYLQSATLFGCGALAALRATDPSPGRLPPAGWTVAAFLGLAVLPLVLWGDRPSFLDDMSNDDVFLALQTALAIPLALALLGLATGEGALSRGLARLSGGARFAYTLYVIHNPLIVLIFSLRAHLGIAPGPWGTAACIVLSILVAEVVSIAAARLVERPRLYREAARRLLARMGLLRSAPERALP